MPIELSTEEVKAILPSIQRYMREEFELEIGEMSAGFLLKYFLLEVGPLAYNKGVEDAERFFRQKVEDLPAVCFEQGLTYWTKKRK